MEKNEEKDIDNLLSILDNFAVSGTGRMKLQVSEELPPEMMNKQYHHGRCDIGSPWAKGQAFDVLE